MPFKKLAEDELNMQRTKILEFMYTEIMGGGINERSYRNV